MFASTFSIVWIFARKLQLSSVQPCVIRIDGKTITEPYMETKLFSPFFMNCCALWNYLYWLLRWLVANLFGRWCWKRLFKFCNPGRIFSELKINLESVQNIIVLKLKTIICSFTSNLKKLKRCHVMCLPFHREDYLEDFTELQKTSADSFHMRRRTRFDLSDERPRSRDGTEWRKERRESRMKVS